MMIMENKKGFQMRGTPHEGKLYWHRKSVKEEGMEICLQVNDRNHWNNK